MKKIIIASVLLLATSTFACEIKFGNIQNNEHLGEIVSVSVINKNLFNKNISQTSYVPALILEEAKTKGKLVYRQSSNFLDVRVYNIEVYFQNGVAKAARIESYDPGGIFSIDKKSVKCSL